jgi:hypothetical protein
VGSGVGTWPCARMRMRGVARRRTLQSAGRAQPSGQRAVDCLTLQKFELNNIFSKYESCSVKYPLQLLQRVIGCLVKGLAGNVC